MQIELFRNASVWEFQCLQWLNGFTRFVKGVRSTGLVPYRPQLELMRGTRERLLNYAYQKQSSKV